MRITVNGEPREVADTLDVQGLLVHLELTQGLVAVEVNREVVPRARHAGTRLAEGDAVEIVHFVGGG
ncbi:MAG: sulfur carrier protein ThiS [Polyangiaceae bacterium]|nr:sulfur carrier protein ThiS [Polyangiaceae bacterium]